MNIEELRRKSLEQFSELRKKALNEAYLNAPIRNAAGASSSGSTQAEPEPPLPTEPNFDISATNWEYWNVVDEASFITFLESGGGDGGREKNSFTDISVTDFTFVDNRIRCNLTATTDGVFYLNDLGITVALKLGNTLFSGLILTDNNITDFNIQLPISCLQLNLSNNDIITFDPTIPLPGDLESLNLSRNQITEFNPSLPLPGTLNVLFLNNNLITEFDPDLPLPSGLVSFSIANNDLTFFNPTQWPNSVRTIDFSKNNMTLAGYTASEPWANGLSTVPPGSNITFSLNADSVSGTPLATILASKGYTITL